MGSIDSSDWWAHVRFPSPRNTVSNVPVKDIAWIMSPKDAAGKRSKTPFVPQTIKDFNKNQLYCLTTSEKSVDGKAHPYYCYIGLMAESQEKLEEELKHLEESSKRVGFGRPEFALSDPESSASEDSRLSGRPHVVVEARDKAKAIGANKRAMQNRELESTLRRHKILPAINMATESPVNLPQHSSPNNVISESSSLVSNLGHQVNHVQQQVSLEQQYGHSYQVQQVQQPAQPVEGSYSNLSSGEVPGSQFASPQPGGPLFSQPNHQVLQENLCPQPNSRFNSLPRETMCEPPHLFDLNQSVQQPCRGPLSAVPYYESNRYTDPYHQNQHLESQLAVKEVEVQVLRSTETDKLCERQSLIESIRLMLKEDRKETVKEVAEVVLQRMGETFERKMQEKFEELSVELKSSAGRQCKFTDTCRDYVQAWVDALIPDMRDE